MLAAPLSAVLHLCLLLATGAYAQDRTTEQGEAAVTSLCLPFHFPHITPSFLTSPRLDPSAECTPYSYPPVAAAVADGQFPPIWTNASKLLPNDTEGRAKFLVINGSVPAISPKVRRSFLFLPLLC
jgi:hypothetical protein